MWSDSPYEKPRPSFLKAVRPPQSEPDDPPCICVRFAAEYQPYILGALQQLQQDTTWKLGTGDDMPTVEGRINLLMDMFGASSGCTTLPTIPPGVEPADMDCAIAGYIVNEVVREGVQIAINKSLGSGGPQGILFYALDLLPWSNVWVPKIADGITGLIVTIGLNEAFDWVVAQGEQGLWDLVGCTVYHFVQGVHGFTNDSLASIVAAIRAIGGDNAPLLGAIADFLESQGADVWNGLADLAGQATYDCTACGTGTGGPTTANPPLRDMAGLEMTDGTLDLLQVRKLQVPSGDLSGTAYDAVVTIPSPLEITDGTTDLTAVKKITFSGATVTGAAGIATVAGLEGPTGPTGPEGPTGPTGPTGPAGPALGASSDLNIDSGLPCKCLDLWNGATNNAPPAGWEATSFDASAWPSAVAEGSPVEDSGHNGVGDATWLWSQNTAYADHGEVLFQQKFVLPLGAIDSAQLVTTCDDYYPAFYVNGVLIFAETGGTEADTSVAHTLTNLVADGVTENVVSIHAANNNGAHYTGPHAGAGINWQIQLVMLSAIGPAGATGPEGPTGPTGPTGPAGADAAPGAGAITLLASISVTGAPQATIDFTAIPGTGRHLELIATARGTNASDYVSTNLKFNGDGAGNYDVAFTDSTGHFEQSAVSGIVLGYIDGGNQAAGNVGSFRIMIPNYAASDVKKTVIMQGYSGAALNRIIQVSGEWFNTAPITELSISLNTGNFEVGSRFDLYAWN